MLSDSASLLAAFLLFGLSAFLPVRELVLDFYAGARNSPRRVVRAFFLSLLPAVLLPPFCSAVSPSFSPFPLYLTLLG